MPDEVGGSTFTLTNAGVFGDEFGMPIINQPESAILAIGGLRKEPVVLTDAEGNDTIAIRSMQYYCLGIRSSADRWRRCRQVHDRVQAHAGNLEPRSRLILPLAASGTLAKTTRFSLARRQLLMQSTPQQSVVAHPALPAAIARARRHVVPYMLLLYVISFLDRANISFAKQAMQASIGISEQTYALAAGLFFISYSLCGFPSNLVLHKIGAKYWLSSLMVGWGLVSMATMFVTGSTSFYVLRLLLGILEAGFFPGSHSLSDVLVS